MQDRAAEGFDDFFRRQHPALVGIGLAMLGDVEAARDASQEALLRALRDWRRVSGLERPDMWVRRVMVNLAIDQKRSRVRELRHASGVAAAEVSTQQPSPAEADDVWSAVRALPERQRAAVVLRYVEDLSIDDIASVLGVTDGTVKASLSQARASLARRLAVAEEVLDG